MMAFLHNEPGVDVVEDILTEPGSTCYAHVFNLCEIYYLTRLKKSIPRDVLLTAIHENANGVIATADLETSGEVDREKEKREEKKEKNDGVKV